MHSVKTSRLVQPLLSFRGWVLFLVLVAAQFLIADTFVHAAVVVTPRVTLVVFADKRLPDDQWAALSAALHRGFDEVALDSRFGGFDVVRGETLVPGIQFEAPISIFVHGDCRVLPQPGPHALGGALGWVLRDRGQIQPFIHVDCARIAAVLGSHALGRDQAGRNSVIAEAISRVILHEWVHIATQNPAHTHDGIEKRAFSAQDLLPDYSKILPRSGGK